MKKVKIFLASSAELKSDRENFEIEIYRKCKHWIDKGTFLHLDIWEDASAKLSSTRSQDEYNKMIRQSDLFVLLAHTKVGMYTHEEFITAQGQFRVEQKPFIFTYFKRLPLDFNDRTKNAKSLRDFQKKLSELGHFYCHYVDANDLWNQFNKELERLDRDGFGKNERESSDHGQRKGGNIVTQGEKSVYIEKGDNLNIQIH